MQRSRKTKKDMESFTFQTAWSHRDYSSLRRMDPASEALPDDVAALEAALIAERARQLETVGAEGFAESHQRRAYEKRHGA